ncbi:unnamed protein product [Prunus armeniaca]
MDPSLYEAARSGDVGFLRKIKDADVPDDLLHQKTPMDNNILHIAAEFKHIDFFISTMIPAGARRARRGLGGG